MRKCKVYKCKREALGLSQANVANEAGVSPGSVSRFEAGEIMSEPYFKAISTVIDEHLRSLSEREYLEVMLSSNVLQLAETETDEERLRTLNFMAMYIARLQLAIMSEN